VDAALVMRGPERSSMLGVMPADAPFDLLLLDFGGVCLLNPVELHDKAERLLGLDRGTLTWLGPLDPSTDPLWQQMISGDGLTERQYWTKRAEEVGNLAGQTLTRAQYMTMLYDPPSTDLVRPGANRVRELAVAAGYQVSVLTNDMRDFHGRTWEHGIPFLQAVDHIIDCSDTRILKPDPRAFARAADITGVAPGRTLFVDDQPINVQGAIDFGLEAMWFDIAHAAQSWSGVAERLGV